MKVSANMSFNDKIAMCFILANQVVDRCETDPAFAAELESSEHIDLTYAHADGLTARRLYRLRDGSCSLQAIIDFDFEAEEKHLFTAIGIFNRLLEQK